MSLKAKIKELFLRAKKELDEMPKAEFKANGKVFLNGVNGAYSTSEFYRYNGYIMRKADGVAVDVVAR